MRNPAPASAPAPPLHSCASAPPVACAAVEGPRLLERRQRLLDRQQRLVDRQQRLADRQQRLLARRRRLLARDITSGANAPERRPFWIFTGFVTEGHEPPNTCVGASQWQAATTVDEVLTADGTMLRAADAAGGYAVTPGDVAAGRVATSLGP